MNKDIKLLYSFYLRPGSSFLVSQDGNRILFRYLDGAYMLLSTSFVFDDGGIYEDRNYVDF